MPVAPLKDKATLRQEARLVKLQAEVAALKAQAEAKLRADPERDLYPSNSPVGPFRRWHDTYNFAANVDPRNDAPGKIERKLDLMVTLLPFFDLHQWLLAVAKPGERITVSMCQRL